MYAWKTKPTPQVFESQLYNFVIVDCPSSVPRVKSRRERRTSVPYLSGETPKVGDRVKHADGQTGEVTNVQLNFHSTSGADVVSVKFDNGMYVSVSRADEYTRQ